MDNGMPQPPDDDFEVDVSALQRPAHQAPHRTRWGSWWTTDLTPGRSLSRLQRRGRQATAAGAVLVALVVIAASVWGNPLPQVLGGISRWLAPHPARPPVTRVVISSAASSSTATSTATQPPQQDGVSCLATDPAWSPDGARIAVLGYQTTCPTPQNRYEPALLNLYDGQSGALMSQIQPDAAVLAALPSASPLPPPTTAGSFGTPTATPDASRLSAVVYVQVAWSPDGRRLALAFFVLGPTQQPIGSGLLLLDADGGHPRVLLQPQATSWGVPQEWDLLDGVPLPIAPNSASGALPAALAYRWSAGGTLLPEGVLSQDRVPPVPPFAPVGNPDGDAAFTLWQPSELAPASAPPTLYAFGPNISAWSPDGRYLIVGLNLGGILVPVGQSLPDRQGLDLQHYGTLPFVPMRDAALQVASYDLSGHDLSGHDLSGHDLSGHDLSRPVVAWRPDGRVLAAYGSEASGTAVVLYDCATGRRLATLSLPQAPVSLLGIAAAVRWSPDGSRLVLSSAQWGPVVLWGPNQLPH